MVPIKILYASFNSIIGNSIGFKALKTANLIKKPSTLPITINRISIRKT